MDQGDESEAGFWRSPADRELPFNDYLQQRPRPLAVAATILVLFVGVIILLRPFSEHMTYGQPERGKTLATVHVDRKTAYFPGVTCESVDPEVITVSLGVHDDPVSFYLSAFLGPQSPDGQYVAPSTALVVGHRPGIAFDQRGSGSVSVSSDLRAQLQGSTRSSAIGVGSLAFRGTDSSGASLMGTVTCAPDAGSS